MNPKAYCITHGMTTLEFIAKAVEVAPKYNKVAHSMASNPGYGLTLRNDVARHIRGTEEHRTKPCKFTFRLLECDSDEFNAARAVFGHSKQGAAEYAIKLYIQAAKEKAASDDYTSEAARVNG